MGWIWILKDPELLIGSGSETWKIQNWIRIWSKSFRIRNTGFITSNLACPVPFPFFTVLYWKYIC